MTIYDAADILTGLFAAVMMVSLYNTFFEKRGGVPNWVYTAGVFLLAALINVSNQIFKYGILNALGMILSFFIISFFYKGNPLIKLIISTLTFLLMTIAEIVVLFGVTIVFGITVTEAVDIPEYRLLGIIVSKTLAFFIINIVRLKYKKNKFSFSPIHWLLFLIIFATSIVAEFLIFRLSYELGNTYLYNMSVWCSFGLLFSTFLVLYLYERLSRQSEIIYNKEQYERNLKMQVKHLDEILVSQNQVKKFGHDFSNYTIGLQSYIDAGDLEGAGKYVKSLHGAFNPSGEVIDTGNTALDAIISTKKAIAESKGIHFATKIQIPKEINVSPTDICVIFGNALDNAIEACERIKDGERRIELALVWRNESLFCKITNTAENPHGAAGKTSKKDKLNHGFGIENIKTALEKYGGEPTIERGNGQYTLKFVIFTE